VLVPWYWYRRVDRSRSTSWSLLSGHSSIWSPIFSLLHRCSFFHPPTPSLDEECASRLTSPRADPTFPSPTSRGTAPALSRNHFRPHLHPLPRTNNHLLNPFSLLTNSHVASLPNLLEFWHPRLCYVARKAPCSARNVKPELYPP
jgi:hypothetical protein